ncbi:hypothetical protein J2W15_001387 [Pseudarthrobacter sulfonivorans]|nr:hypothetical protein [Pseudarthrobacter sulfonivorans]
MPPAVHGTAAVIPDDAGSEQGLRGRDIRPGLAYR